MTQNDQPWAKAASAASAKLPGQEVDPTAAPAHGGQAGMFGGQLHSVRQSIEDQIGQALDHYAGHVPGGHQFTPEAKKAIAGVLDGLQNQLEREAASRLGGLGSAAFGNPQSPQSGQQTPQSGQGSAL